MYEACSFNSATKEYLTVFYEILDQMIQGMGKAYLTNNISQNFIVQMIPHHKAAIQMSENVLKYTTDNTVRKIASNIITEQTQSIHDMQHALCPCLTKNSPCQDIHLYRREVHNIMHTMYTGMNTACATNNITDNFMLEMIPHHQGAVAMSMNALRYCICPELVPILNSIIISQEQGIQEMKQLLS